MVLIAKVDTLEDFITPTIHPLTPLPGGKQKPLKAAKKAAKELDEDDLAFLEKKRAGMDILKSVKSFLIHADRYAHRGEGSQGHGQQGRWQGPSEHRIARHQEERKEMSNE